MQQHHSTLSCTAVLYANTCKQNTSFLQVCNATFFEIIICWLCCCVGK